MKTHVRADVGVMLRALLPFPDPVRRHRVRASVRALVRCEPWPGDSATSADVAQLALVRLLWLQRQVRRSSWTRSAEAAVVLARSSVETCLLGLYCLHTKDAVETLSGANRKVLKDMVGYLVDEDIVSQQAVDQSAAALGPTARPPMVRHMAELVDTSQGGAGAVSLYRRFYVPTSAFFIHANAASLLRHVATDNTLSDRPRMPWTRRSAVQVSDACIGLLGAAVATSHGEPTNAFEQYADAHLQLAVTPLAIIFGQGLRQSMNPVALFSAIRTVLDLRRYARSEQAAMDTPQERETRLRAGLSQALHPLSIDVSDEVFQPVLDDSVARLLDAIAEHAVVQDGTANVTSSRTETEAAG